MTGVDKCAYESKLNEFVHLMWQVFRYDNNAPNGHIDDRQLSTDDLHKLLEDIDKHIALRTILVHVRIAESKIRGKSFTTLNANHGVAIVLHDGIGR